MLVFKLERVKNIFENEKPKLKFYEIKKRTKVQKLILTYGKVSILKKSWSTIVIYEIKHFVDLYVRYGRPNGSPQTSQF